MPTTYRTRAVRRRERTHFVMIAIGTAMLVVFGGLFACALPARAATDAPKALTCAADKGFKVNPDENGGDPKQGDRNPVQTEAGLTFKGNQLTHHTTKLRAEDLTPGTYTAAPAPSIDDFFSVEVVKDDGTGYATLRYDSVKQQWNIGGTSFYDADPAKLATDHGRGTNVISFGVGYVNTPATGTPTTVSVIRFRGVTYDLTCEAPAPAISPTPTKTPTPKPTPHASASASRSPAVIAAVPSLPVTGPGNGLLALLGIGASATLIGAAALTVRRRRTTFKA